MGGKEKLSFYYWFFVSLLSLFHNGIVKAEGTIYIRADGSVEGTDKIQKDGNIYTFAGEIFNSIVVEKDDIVIDGASYSRIPLFTFIPQKLSQQQSLFINQRIWCLSLTVLYPWYFNFGCSDISYTVIWVRFLSLFLKDSRCHIMLYPARWRCVWLPFWIIRRGLKKLTRVACSVI